MSAERGNEDLGRAERALPDAEIALLRAMLARAGTADASRLDRIEASLRDGKDTASRWQKIAANGVPAATARELRERWRREGALAAELDKGLAGRPALERALGWHLLRTGAVDPKALAAAIDKAAAAALGRRKIGIQQLLVEATQLSPARLCAAIAEAGQSILVCADCGRSNWQAAVEKGSMLLCEGCQGRLAPARGEPTADLACPIGYDSLDAPVAALLRDGVAYGEPLVTDTSGALFEALGQPGRLTKRLATRATAETLKDLRKASNAARRLDCPALAAPASVDAAHDGAFLAFELPPGRPLAAIAGTMREGEALAIVRDVARGLAALHKAELAHGALRPAAVWIADGGGALLVFAGEALQPGLDPAAIPGDRYRGGRAGREGDLHALGAMLVAIQAGDVPTGPDAPALSAIPPRSAELARRCMGGAPPFAHAGEVATELAQSAAEPRARSIVTELSTTLGERASRASAGSTTVRRSTAPGAISRPGTARRPPDGASPTPEGGVGRHRARTPSSAAGQPPARRTISPPVIVGGAGALMAIVAIALLLNRPGPGPATPVIVPRPDPVPTPPVVQVPVTEEDKERLAVLLGKHDLAGARTLVARIAPSAESRARLVVDALLLVEPVALLALVDAADWPELAQTAATVAAQPGFTDALRREAERALAAGTPAVAQRLAAAAIKDSGARETWLLKALGELDLDQLARLKAEAATADWSELERAIAARIASPEHKVLVMQRAGELVGAGTLEAAELSLLAALGTEQVDDSTWDEVVRPLAPDALSRAIDAAAALRRWDRLARRAGRELAVRAPELANARAKEAINGAIDLMDADRHAEAVVRLNAYLALRPDDYKGYGMRGNAYRLQGLEDLALTDYQRTLELRPADPVALNNRAIIFRDRGQIDRALADHDEALRRNDDPDQRPGLLLNRSITLYLARQLDRADADTAELVTFFKGAPADAQERVRPYLDFLDAIGALIGAERGDKAAAAARLAPLLERRPGLLLTAAGPIKVAAELARRISVLLPEHPLPHVERFAILQYYGQLEEAVAALEAARALATGPHAAHKNQIDVELERTRRALVERKGSGK